MSEEYTKMSTVDLRKLVISRGIAKGAAVAVARKGDLIALLEGTRTALPAVSSLVMVVPDAMKPMGDRDVNLKLTASNPVEAKILAYLKANASDTLAEKINTGTKTLASAVKYATGEAHKLASGGNMICVDDDTVYGWIIHYFEDVVEEAPKAKPEIKLPTGVAKRKPVKRAPKPVVVPEPVTVEPEPPKAAEPVPEPVVTLLPPDDEVQQSLFEGMMEEKERE